MKKLCFLFLTMVLSVSVMAQQKIQLRSADKAECVKSDMTGLQASFSFSTIEAQDVESQRGTFSWLNMANTVIGGNEGDPQIPVVNQLIAVPFGANPRIEITSYSTTDYRLEDLGIHTLVPRQLPVRKSQRLEDAPFIINEAAYQRGGLRSEPVAIVEVMGTMRGVCLGKMTIEPVSYDPVSNTLRVFNDIEVTVNFDGADAQVTEQMLVDTYSPYFDIVYKQLFNGRAVRSAYDDHPDLYTTPVKMLVVTTSNYANSTAFQNWLTWKKQKGIVVDVQTVTSSTSSANVRSLIQSRYNANHPTFLVIVGDESAVKYYETYSEAGNSYNPYISDNPYASIDNDVYHDMYMSRMAVSSTTELSNLVNKTLTYEKYTMSDPSYLNNVLLIAGYDQGTWDDRVGRPTIQYALNNYYNAAHGFSNVYSYITDNYSGCYNYLSSGVGFVNYTAHGGIQGWSSPSLSNSDVNSLTNNDKYFWAVGNCCLTGNWGNTSSYPCFGEELIRAANKGAFCYIGSVPETLWYEDYYFGVGAFPYVAYTVQTTSSTTTGMYDALFDDTGFNTVNSVPYIGNVAVTYAHAAGYQSSVSDEYYWRAYQCFGDGSVMPYLVAPTANNVTHASTLGIGMTSFVVNADPGSYVSITKNNEILGVAQVGNNGSAEVQITPVTTAGDVMIVVTRQQRQPYISTIQAVALDGPYVSVDGYTPTEAHVGDNTNLSITFKNVGTASTSGTTTVTLTPGDDNVTVVTPTKTFGALAANATTTVNGFSFRINPGVADGTNVTLHYAAVNGSNTWEGDLVITAGEAILEYQHMTWDGSFVPGETITVSATFKNVGHYQATNAQIALTSSNEYVTVNTQPISAGTIEVGQEVTYDFSLTIAANCPETAQLPITFTMTADGGLSATGDETLKNSCMLYFNLADSYGDGWNGSTLTVSFDDGTDSQTLTIPSGNSSSYEIEVGNGVHVTLTWSSGSQWDYECSFTVSYEGDLVIYQSSGTPSAGVLYEFDCNCAAASQTFMVNVSSSNPAYGTVSGGGEFSYGQSCTVTATANPGYYFSGWTLDGELVSSEVEYTFNVTSDMNLVANFVEVVEIGIGSTSNVNLPSYSYYKQALSQQIYTATEIGTAGTINCIAFYNEGAERTRKFDFYLKTTTKNSFSSKTDWITVSNSDKVFSGEITMAANTWTFIVFDTPFEYDGTSNLVLVTDDNTGRYDSAPHMSCSVYNTSNSQAIYAWDDNYNFNPVSPSSSNVSGNSILSMKNHILLGIDTGTPQEEQTIVISTGWGWWSTYLDITLEQLEEALGNNASGITSQYDGFDSYISGLGWQGSLTSISPAKMYKLETDDEISLTLTGTPVNPADYPITLTFGDNWVGYPVSQSMSLSEAFAGANPVNGDKVSSYNAGYAQYYNGTWYGALQTLQPGQGYVYNSNSSTTKTFTFPSGNKSSKK